MEDYISTLDEALTSPHCMFSTILSIVLQNPDSMNSVNEEGVYPLHNAILHSQRADIIYELLNYGADANIIDKWGNSPIINAIITYRNSDTLLGVVKHLLKFGADVNFKNFNGERPLHVLFSNVEHNKLMKVLDTLMEKGVNLDHTEGNFRSYLLSANDIKDLSIRLEALRTLLQFGVKPECDLSLLDYNININEKINPHFISCIKLLMQYLLVYKIRSNTAENLNDIQFQKFIDLGAFSEQEYYGELIQYRNDLIRQLIMMMHEKIKRGMSLFDFISERCASGLFYHEKDELILCRLLSIFYSNRYASCNDLFQASFKRDALLPVMCSMCIFVKKQISQQSYNSIVVLTCDSLYHLAEYLSKSDILNFILAYWSPDKRISVKRCLYIPKSKSDMSDCDPLERMVKRMRMDM